MRSGDVWFRIVGVVPSMLLILGVMGFCFVFLAWLSATETSTFDLFGGEFTGLETLQSTVDATSTRVAIRNSAVWIVGSVATVMVLGIALGDFLSRETLPVRLTRAFMLLPWVLPGVVVAAIWRWGFSSQTGFINDFVTRIGLMDTGHPWLGDPSTALYAVMAVMVWRLFALVGLVIGAAVQTIDTEVEEAAAVDGASRWQLFYKVRLPIIKPHIYTMTLLVAIWVANNLVFVHAMTGGGPVNSSLILPVEIVRLAFTSYDLSAAAVVSLINVLVLLALAVVFFRISGMMSTSRTRP